MITLTEEQEAARERISLWLASKATCFTLTGSAGTGKTTLVSYVIATLNAEKIGFIYLAPTHNAVMVMKTKLQPQGLDGRCFTLAKGANRILCKEDVKPYLRRVPGVNSLFNSSAVVIVDEASWVGDKTFTMLLDEAEEYNCKLLFVGDRYQLKPPQEEASWPMFNKANMEVVELKTVVRQAEGSPIIKLAQRTRRSVARKEPLPEIEEALDAHGRGVHLLYQREVLNSISPAIRDHGNVCLFTYTNDRLKIWSHKIRKRLYGVEPGAYWIPGERVTNIRWTSGPGDVCLYSHQKSTVVSVGEAGRHPDYDLEYTSIVLRPDGHADNFHAREIMEPDALRATLKGLYNQANAAPEGSSKRRHLWSKYHTLKDEFVQLTSAYVSTIHSAQGQTLDAVWVDMDDVLGKGKRFEVNRMVYVALTRAANSVYFFRRER